MVARQIFHVIESTATGTLAMASLLANCQFAVDERVTVIYSRRPESPKDIESFFTAGVELIEVPMRGLFALMKATYVLRSIFAQRGSGIVFFHSSVAGFVGRLALIAALPKQLSFYIPHCISFMRADIGFFRKTLFILLERLSGMVPCTYIACSKSEMNCIQRYLPSADCVLVENASPVRPDTELKLQAGSDRLRSRRVISVGQIRLQKNPERFARIARHFQAATPSVEFVWIGDGEEKSKKIMRDAGITVTGWLRKDEVVAHLASSNIYLSTSSWEGLPVSLIEAMAFSLVTIASSCTGNIDIVTNGVTGYLFDSDEEAIDQIRKVLTDDEHAMTLGSRARVDFLERFTVSQYAARIRQVVETRSRQDC